MRFTSTPQHATSYNRAAVTLYFFLAGASFANWVARIPAVKAALGLSEATLGVALLGLSVGVIVALPLCGGLIQRYSSRRVILWSAVGAALSMPWLALAPSGVLLAAALFVFGAFGSSLDVAMNAQAVEVETRLSYPIMSSCHAAFSIGGFVGAAMSSFFAANDISLLVHFGIVTLLMLAATGASVRFLLPDTVTADADEAAPAFTLPPRALWGLGIVVFCATISEGAVADWSTLYLQDVAGAAAGISAWGFAAFSLTMTAGRLSGDALAARISPARLVRSGGFVASLGLIIVLWVPQPMAGIIGFGLTGIGLSVIVPLVFSAAGNVDGITAGRGIAGVATIGYMSFLAGPPLIGIVAEATSLTFGLGLLLLAVATLTVTGSALDGHQQ